MIVNQAFADQFFPGQEALGKNITQGVRNDPKEIVGIAGNVRQQGLRTAAEPAIYAPYSQFLGSETLLVLRSDLPAAASWNSRRRRDSRY